MGLGVLPTDCSQVAILGTHRRFNVQDQIEGEIPNDGGKWAETYSASLMVRHFFGQGWSAEVIVPTGSMKVKTQAGDPIHLSGFGDIDLASAYDFAAIWGAGGYLPSVELTLGLGLPTGRQAVIDNTEGIFPANLLALGYGVFSLKAGLSYTQSVHRMLAFKAFGHYRRPTAYSERNIKYGPTMNYGLGVLFRATDWLSVVGQVTGLHMESNTHQSEGKIESSGGDVFAAELSASTTLKDRVVLGVGGRIPFYERLNNTNLSRQLAEKFSVQAFVAVMFGTENENEETEEPLDEETEEPPDVEEVAPYEE